VIWSSTFLIVVDLISAKGLATTPIKSTILSLGKNPIKLTIVFETVSLTEATA